MSIKMSALKTQHTAQPMQNDAPGPGILICGIVMPISAIDNCSESHWADVLDILSESVTAAGFSPNVVSHADDVGIIHKRIIQNLYDNPVVVCDVSGKNPNVMFELGLRLAFDKPTIIVKDDKTSYSFDTSAIEHLEYPRDLRFSRIVDFKDKLTEKIRATHKRANEDITYTTFLKHFGEFTVAKLDKKEVSGQEYLLEEMRMVRAAISRLDRSIFRDSRPMKASQRRSELDFCLNGATDADIAEAIAMASGLGAANVRIRSLEDDKHKHLLADVSMMGSEGCDRLEAFLKLRFKEALDHGYKL
jgi:hypothetical protein